MSKQTTPPPPQLYLGRDSTMAAVTGSSLLPCSNRLCNCGISMPNLATYKQQR